ncbi:MAG: hypothetical protein M1817_003280 [Caeruleum heppii]|nr:MAG: hypothetical protein M1817_003280 [Caeruleum heppii]
MSETASRVARVVSVVAATLIALACGTNYVYSAWAPQFAAKLKLSSTESNLIVGDEFGCWNQSLIIQGTAANLGMYASGIPVGLLVDAKGPRPAVLLGALALGLGYYPLHRAFDSGPDAMGVPLLCFFSLLTGIGSCSAFSACIKTSAVNWPHHRGTATAFPLAAFGLSAFFFSTVSSLAFPENTSDFLFLLAVGTFTMVFVSFFFLRVIPTSPKYAVVKSHEDLTKYASNRLHRTKSNDSRRSVEAPLYDPVLKPVTSETEETASLMSKSSSSGPGDVEIFNDRSKRELEHGHARRLDIRGFSMLPRAEFWELFSLLGLLSGVGLMTINNIGNDAQALWSHYDDSVSPGFIQDRQSMHVSILSVASFSGRLVSGVGSDYIVKRLSMSRFWCSVAASTVFCVGQICATRIENPHYLWSVSGLTGFGYGILYGVYPSMIAEAFGVHGLSQNWGCMTLAPVISGNIFNLLYGTIYDHHSPLLPGSSRTCPEGLACYRSAYYITLAASVLGVVVSLWSIRMEGRRKGEGVREERGAREV